MAICSSLIDIRLGQFLKRTAKQCGQSASQDMAQTQQSGTGRGKSAATKDASRGSKQLPCSAQYQDDGCPGGLAEAEVADMSWFSDDSANPCSPSTGRSLPPSPPSTPSPTRVAPASRIPRATRRNAQQQAEDSGAGRCIRAEGIPSDGCADTRSEDADAQQQQQPSRSPSRSPTARSQIPSNSSAAVAKTLEAALPFESDPTNAAAPVSPPATPAGILSVSAKADPPPNSMAELQARLEAAEQLASNAVAAAQGWRSIAMQSTSAPLLPSNQDQEPASTTAPLPSMPHQQPLIELSSYRKSKSSELPSECGCSCGWDQDLLGLVPLDCIVCVRCAASRRTSNSGNMRAMAELDAWAAEHGVITAPVAKKTAGSDMHCSSEGGWGGGGRRKHMLPKSLSLVLANPTFVGEGVAVAEGAAAAAVVTPFAQGNDTGAAAAGLVTPFGSQSKEWLPFSWDEEQCSRSTSSCLVAARRSTHSSQLSPPRGASVAVAMQTDPEPSCLQSAICADTSSVGVQAGASASLASVGVQADLGQASTATKAACTAAPLSVPQLQSSQHGHSTGAARLQVQLGQRTTSLRLLQGEFHELERLQRDTEMQRREFTARYAFCVLDEDHDGYIRSDQVALLDMFQPWSPVVLEVALARWRSANPYRGYLMEDDFVAFVNVADERGSRDSLRFWFSVLDMDCDGVIGPEDAKWFYDAAVLASTGGGARQEAAAAYVITFEGLWLQILDMVKPRQHRRGFTCSELWKCKLGAGVTGLLLNHRNMLMQRTTLEWGRNHTPL